MARFVVKAWVSGGYFDDSGECVIWLVDFATERAEIVLRWTPPSLLCVPSKGFAGGSMDGDGTLYLAAHAAVVRIDTRIGAVTGVLHQPCMNDLHHVAVRGDRLYVANTGLSAVDVFDVHGSFHGSFALLPAWANSRRFAGEALPAVAPLDLGWTARTPAQWGSRDDACDDYFCDPRGSEPFHRRKVRDHLHVNHVAFVGDRLVATCFADGSLRDLRSFEVLRRLPGSFIHDGIPQADALWVTAIDGTIYELDAVSLTERRHYATFETGHFGWCRGLAVADEWLAVGLTEVRRAPTPRFWDAREPEGSETSVLLLDRQDGRLRARVDLGDTRHSKIYSILPTEDP